MDRTTSWAIYAFLLGATLAFGFGWAMGQDAEHRRANEVITGMQADADSAIKGRDFRLDALERLRQSERVSLYRVQEIKDAWISVLIKGCR